MTSDSDFDPKSKERFIAQLEDSGFEQVPDPEALRLRSRIHSAFESLTERKDHGHTNRWWMALPTSHRHSPWL